MSVDGDFDWCIPYSFCTITTGPFWWCVPSNEVGKFINYIDDTLRSPYQYQTKGWNFIKKGRVIKKEQMCMLCACLS